MTGELREIFQINRNTGKQGQNFYFRPKEMLNLKTA